MKSIKDIERAITDIKKAMAIIDFHAHILPGLDDGSRSCDMTAQMLQVARAQRIDTIVATPHFYAESMRIKDFLYKRQRAFSEVQEQEECIRIICGAEVFFFPGMARAEGLEQLQIGETNLLLLEMPFRPWSAYELNEVDLLLRRGIRPIIAHLERFYRFQTDRAMIPALLDMPVIVQINAEYLLNWRTRRKALKLFQNGQAHLLGSDCHNVSSRPENLGEGRIVLEQKIGASFLKSLDEFGTSLLGME